MGGLPPPIALRFLLRNSFEAGYSPGAWFFAIFCAIAKSSFCLRSFIWDGAFAN
jgi:hypothetical protein